MTLTTYQDVQHWFNSNQNDATEGGKTASHWTLYGGNYGEKEIRLLNNTRLDSANESLAFLIDTIRRMNHPNGAKFRVQIYKPGSPNNYTAQTFVQIYDTEQQPGYLPQQQQQQAGIGSLPSMNTENYINERIELALLKKENEDLRASMNGPNNMVERVLDIISQSEPLSMALSGLISGLAGRHNIGMPQALPRPVTGSPDSDEEANEADAQAVFANNINAASAALDTDPVSLSKSLVKLIQGNPQFAKQIFSQAQ